MLSKSNFLYIKYLITDFIEKHITKRHKDILCKLVIRYMSYYMKEHNLSYELYADVNKGIKATLGIFKSCRICKIKKKLFSNEVTIYCKFPSYIIGYRGITIAAINKLSKYRVFVEEYKKESFEDIIDNCFIVYDPDYCSYKDKYNFDMEL